MGLLLRVVQDELYHGGCPGEAEHVGPDVPAQTRTVKVLHGVEIAMRPDVCSEIPGREGGQARSPLSASSPDPLGHHAEEAVILRVEA